MNFRKYINFVVRLVRLLVFKGELDLPSEKGSVKLLKNDGQFFVLKTRETEDEGLKLKSYTIEEYLSIGRLSKSQRMLLVFLEEQRSDNRESCECENSHKIK